jgi:hypothetical protein
MPGVDVNRDDVVSWVRTNSTVTGDPPPSQGAQLRSLFDALHQAVIKYSPPIYPVDLALVTLKEALDQIP